MWKELICVYLQFVCDTSCYKNSLALQECNNYSINKLSVGLRLGDSVDDEFIEKRLLDRWKAEPVRHHILSDSSLYFYGYHICYVHPVRESTRQV